MPPMVRVRSQPSHVCSFVGPCCNKGKGPHILFETRFLRMYGRVDLGR
jgi:hypothetical protein